LLIFKEYKPQQFTNKELFIQRATKWVSDNSYSLSFLNFSIARIFYEQGDFPNAQRHYLLSNNPEEYGYMLIKWSNLGNPNEADLFIARPVFEYLCISNIKDAFFILDLYLKIKEIETPLTNFLRFLLQSLNSKNIKLYKSLINIYTPSLNRDPSFLTYLGMISMVYFNIPETGYIINNHNNLHNSIQQKSIS